jgi:hypothetical protein
MKRVLVVLAFLGLTFALALPASAASTHYNSIGSPFAKDSQAEALAALTLHQFPGAVITSAQIEAAQAAFPYSGAQISAATYVTGTGFDGHLASAFNLMYVSTDLSPNVKPPIEVQNEIIRAARSGGIYVGIDNGAPGSGGSTEQNAEPAIAIVGATAKLITLVNANGPYTVTWAAFNARYNPVNEDTFYSVAWS